ncbi:MULTISPECIES: aldehyde dehydrogenase family protein [Agrobacterium]|uniref:Aldehyde dehydrogenase n=1 Tax=Agrobacterium tumefaciens TaxID=358 RepID=A0A176XH91_AGRTU|nr:MULTISPECIES: aldehyde dehydrogenase family protein [Agrobacterium]NTE48098.1 aldehyde dehydrogenase family protein [Agrobacterium pusense]OAE48214.1 aldehyde dehydrogenase [Agrobacterium tumefaciens]
MTAMLQGRLLIDGEIVDGEAGWSDSINPADETVIGRVSNASANDVARAVDAGRRAWPGWAERSIEERGEIIRDFADRIISRSDEIARTEVLDSGNTLRPTLNAMGEIQKTARYYAGIAYMLRGATIPATPNNMHMTIFEPYGVVGRIAAYNHPALFSVARALSALVAGNAVVAKPPETCPLSALAIAEIARDVLPRGIYNVVNGTGGEVGNALVRSPHVKRLALIGSVPTGMAIQRSAAEVAVKHVTLELGGKNPMIVFPDVDPDRAADGAIEGMNFAWQGQSCGSNSRVLVHDDIYDAVVERITARAAAIRTGDPMSMDSGMGPVNSAKAYAHVTSFLDPQQTQGARLMTGGKRPRGREFEKGYWIEPTVFADVTKQMRLWREEVFGPILSIARWRDYEEMVALANDTEYGLSAAIWTNDISLALKTARRVRAGSIFINGSNRHLPGLPWGGFKNSGIDREEGVEEILSYLETKTINIML